MSHKELSDARSRFVDIAERLQKFNQKTRMKCAVSIKAVEGRLIMLQADKALTGLLSAAFTALNMGRIEEAKRFIERAIAFADGSITAGEKVE